MILTQTLRNHLGQTKWTGVRWELECSSSREMLGSAEDGGAQGRWVPQDNHTIILSGC